MFRLQSSVVVIGLLLVPVGVLPAETTLTGSVIDSVTGRPLPARIFLHSAGGRWFHARSASPEGSAVDYNKQRGKTIVEIHP